MTTEIFYFDFYLGRADQSPTAWTPIRAKVAALTPAKALDTFCALGFNRDNVMRIDQFMVKALNGSTVVQYKWINFQDTQKLLIGLGDAHDKPVVKVSRRKR